MKNFAYSEGIRGPLFGNEWTTVFTCFNLKSKVHYKLRVLSHKINHPLTTKVALPRLLPQKINLVCDNNQNNPINLSPIMTFITIK